MGFQRTDVQAMLQGKLLFWNVFVLIKSVFLKSGFAHRCVLKRFCNISFYLQFYALHNLR